MARAGIVYVGTNAGLVTYSDPGETGKWRRTGHSLDGTPIQAVDAIDAMNLIVALADGPPQRSTDGGNSWVNAQPAECTHLIAPQAAGAAPPIATAQGLAHWTGAHHPATDAVALALLSGRQETMLASGLKIGPIARSEDGGASWTAVATPEALQGKIQVIQPSSYHMDIAWAGTDAGELLYSEDRGRSWRLLAREEHAIRCLAVTRAI
jgi:photosystem II stability/assembly factor-like uncharacterized protein